MLCLFYQRFPRASLVCNKFVFRNLASNSSDLNELNPAPSDLNLIESYKYCLNHIRKYDRDNYLAALCIEDPLIRRSVVALRAFNVELSLIRDTTTNSDRAKIRFNFWAKLIDEIIRRSDEEYNSDTDKLNAYYNHTPIAKELLDLFHLINIDSKIQSNLRDMIGSRLSSKVLGYSSFDSMNELEVYCRKSNSSLYFLAQDMAFQLNHWVPPIYIQPWTIEASQSLGMAHGLSNIIRGIPYNASKGCCYIPKSVLAKHNLTQRDFIIDRNKPELNSENLKPVVLELAQRCRELLDEADKSIGRVPMFFKQLFLPRVAIKANLKRLKKCQYDICDPKLYTKNGLLPLNLWMASKTNLAPIL